MNRLTERIVLGGCLLATLVFAVYVSGRSGNYGFGGAMLAGAFLAIVIGGRHLLDLINEVLEITRLEVGGATPSIEPVHLETVAREAVELVTPLAGQRKIAMRAEFAAGSDTWVEADRQRLKQILLN